MRQPLEREIIAALVQALTACLGLIDRYIPPHAVHPTVLDGASKALSMAKGEKP